MYPRNPDELVVYLTKHPVLNVKFPHRDTTYTFKESDGTRITFIAADRMIIQFPISGYFIGRVEYNEDGFVRVIERKNLSSICAWFFYTGPKPWQKDKPEWKQQIEDWDLVFEGLKNFCD